MHVKKHIRCIPAIHLGVYLRSELLEDLSILCNGARRRKQSVARHNFHHTPGKRHMQLAVVCTYKEAHTRERKGRAKREDSSGKGSRDFSAQRLLRAGLTCVFIKSCHRSPSDPLSRPACRPHLPSAHPRLCTPNPVGWAGHLRLKILCPWRQTTLNDCIFETGTFHGTCRPGGSGEAQSALSTLSFKVTVFTHKTRQIDGTPPPLLSLLRTKDPAKLRINT